MKIVHLLPGFGLGGVENVLLSICNNFDRQKYDLTLVYFADQEELLDAVEATGVKVIKIQSKKVISFSTIRHLIQILKDESADLIHTHLMDANLLGFLSTKFVNIPQVISLHTYPYPKGIKYRLRYKFMSFWAGKIICVSNIVKNYMVEKVGVSEKKATVVYNGIDIQKFDIQLSDNQRADVRQEFRIPDGHFIIGNVARMIERKGQMYLIQAFHELLKVHPNTTLLIIGDGDYRKDLEQEAKNLNIADKIIFTGSRYDIPELLSIMDIFVFPTYNEAMGITICEAMAARKAIISSIDSAIVELIDNGKDGLLVKPKDSHALFEVILSLCNNPEKRVALAAAAREKANLFSEQSMAEGIEEVYSGLIK